MIFNFSLSLNHIAAVKIALRLYYDKDIEMMLEKELQGKYSFCCFDREKNELWKLIKKTAVEKLPPLPASLKDKVSKLIRPFHEETKAWSQDHICLLGLSVSDSYLTCLHECYLTYKSVLCWKTDGTIDRMQTAKKLAQDRNIDPETRFAVACTYFLEDEVMALWRENEEVRLTRNGKNAAVRFWLKRLKKGSSRKTPWNAMATTYFKTLRFRGSDMPLRVSSFFPYLSWEDKKNYFVFLSMIPVHSDDYRSCFQAITETERMELISPDINLRTCLHEYLKWPFRSLFMEIVNQLWSRVDTSTFFTLLCDIIYSCIFLGLDDFDDVGLLKEFWHQSPASLKNAMKKEGKHFKLIEMTLNYDGRNAPLSLQETMNECARKCFGCICRKERLSE